MAPTNWLWQFCFISSTSWLFNLALDLLVSLVKVVGLALIFRSYLAEIQTFPHSQLTSTWIFRILMATKLSTGNKETIFLNIYRPPSSKISTFLQEFQKPTRNFCSITMDELILHCDTATEGCVSNDFFRHSIDDSPAISLTYLT